MRTLHYGPFASPPLVTGFFITDDFGNEIEFDWNDDHWITWPGVFAWRAGVAFVDSAQEPI